MSVNCGQIIFHNVEFILLSSIGGWVGGGWYKLPGPTMLHMSLSFSVVSLFINCTN
jgi:hypothetical protein